MKLLEKILLATDFSGASGDALRTAAYLAKNFNSEILLLHVLPEGEAYDPDRIKKAATREMQRTADTLIREGVTKVQTILEEGNSFARIINQAEMDDVNLIVMGAGDKSSGDHYPLGTTAEKVIRRAGKPVWVARAGFFPPIRKILCPVDFSEPSKRALHNAVHLARHFRVELTVLHVIQPLFGFYYNLNPVALESQKALETKRQGQFDLFLEEFDFHNVVWKRMVLFGKAEREILNEIRYSGFDLLVMGAVGNSSQPRAMLGAVAEKVVREMPCSLVTLKSENAIRLRLEYEISDIENHLAQGRKLLENGFPREALEEFEYCVEKDLFFAPAWDGMAKAHQRLGHEETAQKSAQMARQIREKFWQRQIEVGSELK